jgi:hypothetical protein
MPGKSVLVECWPRGFKGSIPAVWSIPSHMVENGRQAARMCPECGRRRPVNASVCPHCGALVEATPARTPRLAWPSQERRSPTPVPVSTDQAAEDRAASGVVAPSATGKRDGEPASDDEQEAAAAVASPAVGETVQPARRLPDEAGSDDDAADVAEGDGGDELFATLEPAEPTPRPGRRRARLVEEPVGSRSLRQMLDDRDAESPPARPGSPRPAEPARPGTRETRETRPGPPDRPARPDRDEPGERGRDFFSPDQDPWEPPPSRWRVMLNRLKQVDGLALLRRLVALAGLVVILIALAYAMLPYRVARTDCSPAIVQVFDRKRVTASGAPVTTPTTVTQGTIPPPPPPGIVKPCTRKAQHRLYYAVPIVVLTLIGSSAAQRILS